MNQSCECYIQDYIKKAPSSLPLFPEEIVKVAAKQYSLPKIDLNEMVIYNLEKFTEKIDYFDTTVYYSPKQTVFGKSLPPMEAIITYLSLNEDDDTIGYVGGASLFHQMGLCSLMPSRKTIVTNRFDLPLYDTLLTLEEPPVKISKEIVDYVQMLDVISHYKNTYVDCPSPKKVLKRAIKSGNLEENKLYSLAKQYFLVSVLSELEDILKERNYDTAQK